MLTLWTISVQIWELVEIVRRIRISTFKKNLLNQRYLIKKPIFGGRQYIDFVNTQWPNLQTGSSSTCIEKEIQFLRKICPGKRNKEADLQDPKGWLREHWVTKQAHKLHFQQIQVVIIGKLAWSCRICVPNHYESWICCGNHQEVIIAAAGNFIFTGILRGKFTQNHFRTFSRDRVKPNTW